MLRGFNFSKGEAKGKVLIIHWLKASQITTCWTGSRVLQVY